MCKATSDARNVQIWAEKKFKGFETNVEEKLHCGWPSTKPRNTQNSLFFSPSKLSSKVAQMHRHK